MWGEKQCDVDCHCDGLIPDSFHIATPRSAGKRRREANMNPADMSPLARAALHRSPYLTPSHRTILGRIENSPQRSGGKISRLLDDRQSFSSMDKENIPQNLRKEQNTKPFRKTFSFRSEELFRTEETQSSLSFRERSGNFGSEENSVNFFKKEEKRLEIFKKEERSSFKSETFFKSEVTEGSFFKSEKTEGGFFESEGILFKSDMKRFEKNSFFSSAETQKLSPGASSEGPSRAYGSPIGRGHRLRRMKSLKSWTLAQVLEDNPETSSTPQKMMEELSRDSGCPSSGYKPSSPLLHDEATVDFTHALPETFVPGTQPVEPDTDFETLHDLEEEFEADFDKCSKYEIISTDSPNIISRGSSTRTVSSKNLVFGAPISETEQSTSFNAFRTNPSVRMLNFDEPFDFTSPTIRANEVKKNLTFTDTKENVKPQNELNFDESIFASPTAPTRSKILFSDTPKKNSLRHEKSDSSIGSMSNASPVISKNVVRLFNSESTNSMESGFASEVDDAFLFDAIDSDTLSSPKVANFGDLLRGQIKDQTLLPVKEEAMDITPGRTTLFRSLSLNTDSSLDKVRMSLFKSTLESPTEVKLRGFKRPERQGDTDGQSKRRKSNCDPLRLRRPLLQRALSENCASIMSALHRSATIPDLIGDFSQPCALPLTVGSHEDLKSISGDTLAALLSGKYSDTIAHFKVIDCRYPYEYAGGHIRGARNLYTREHMLQLLREVQDGSGQVEIQDQGGPGRKQTEDGPERMETQDGAGHMETHDGPGHMETQVGPGPEPGRHILIFHCEFSIERGPKLSRYLRTMDRARNKDSYPALRFPEIYLLHHGYSAFYRQFPALCRPQAYVPMLHPSHKTDLVRFRSDDGRETQKSSSGNERKPRKTRLPL